MITRPPVPDDYKLPWGAHKGLAIKDVPVSYLIWLRAQTWIRDYPAIWAYLETRKVELDTAAKTADPINAITASFSTYQDYLKNRG